MGLLLQMVTSLGDAGLPVTGRLPPTRRRLVAVDGPDGPVRLRGPCPNRLSHLAFPSPSHFPATLHRRGFCHLVFSPRPSPPLHKDGILRFSSADAVPACPLPPAQRGDTALHAAANSGHAEVVRALLDGRAAIDARNKVVGANGRIR